jgi:hypothetical protein
MVESWMNGGNPLIEKHLFANPFPYPPAFHMTLALLAIIFNTDAVNVFSFFQIFTFVSILWLFYLLVKEFKGTYPAVLTFSLLVCSFSFWDWTNQPIPTGLDFIIAPLVVFAYLKDRNLFFIFGSVFLVYNHLFYGISLIFGLFMHTLFFKKEKRVLWHWIIGMCIPLAIFYIPHIDGLLVFRDGSGQRFMSNNYFLWNIAYFGYFLTPISLGGLFWILSRKKDEFENVLLCWLVGMLPLLVIVSNRGLTYIVPPLAIMGAIMLDEVSQNEKERYIILICVFFVAILYFLAEFSLFGFDSPFSDWLRRILFTH